MKIGLGFPQKHSATFPPLSCYRSLAQGGLREGSKNASNSTCTPHFNVDTHTLVLWLNDAALGSFSASFRRSSVP